MNALSVRLFEVSVPKCGKVRQSFETYEEIMVACTTALTKTNTPNKQTPTSILKDHARYAALCTIENKGPFSLLSWLLWSNMMPSHTYSRLAFDIRTPVTAVLSVQRLKVNRACVSYSNMEPTTQSEWTDSPIEL